jgi:hypothetical protein
MDPQDPKGHKVDHKGLANWSDSSSSSSSACSSATDDEDDEDETASYQYFKLVKTKKIYKCILHEEELIE